MCSSDLAAADKRYSGVEYYNPTISRWGGSYQQGTTINSLNIFRPADFDEIDRSKGSIQRFMVEDRLLYVYQQRAVGVYGIYAKFIQDNADMPGMTESNIALLTSQWENWDKLPDVIKKEALSKFETLYLSNYETVFKDEASRLKDRKSTRLNSSH